MTGLTRDELRVLMGDHQTPCVSIFMPTYVTGPETQQNPIRLKNLLRTAEEQLVLHMDRPAEQRALLQPIAHLIEDLEFWRTPSQGLAIYLAPDFFRVLKVPSEVEELVVVADRFHVTPVFPMLIEDGHFFILALSQEEIRVMSCDAHNVEQVELENMPKNLAEILRYDEFEKQMQSHSNATATTGSGRGENIRHGHGDGSESARSNLLRYFRAIDVGMRQLLKEETAPLVLAGVESLFPIYREANTYHHVIEEGIPGNPELSSIKELHKRAVQIVLPLMREAQQRDVDIYHEAAARGFASKDPRDAVSLAYQGRVRYMFLNKNEHAWGSFQRDSAEAILHTERQDTDEDLLDLAAAYTFANGGTIHAVDADEMPEEAPVAVVMHH